MRRKKVNKEIRKDIFEYWTPLQKFNLTRRIRKGIFLAIGPFEELEEPKVQEWAHRMIPEDSAMTHLDRLALKASIRRFMRKETVIYLGLSKYFPELFEDEKENNQTKDPESKSS